MVRHLLVVAVLSGACNTDRIGQSTSALHLSPPVRVANQNGFYNGTPTCGATKGVASIGTSWWLPCDTKACLGGSTEFNTFVNKTQAQVECRLSVFLKQHDVEFNATNDGTGCRDASGTILSECPITNGVQECWQSARQQIVIIDFEQPHPMDLYKYTNLNIRKKVENAYKTRIRAADTTFPLATIGLYGTVAADGNGVPPPGGAYEQGQAKLVEAGTRGLFDPPLDILVPVLYPRFGCEEAAVGTICTDPMSARPWCDTPGNWGSYEAYTELGILDSIELAALPLLPLITTRVHNSNSCFGPAGVLLFDMVWDTNKQLSADEVWEQTLGVQLAKMVELDDASTDVTITAAALWTPDDTDVDVDTTQTVNVVLPEPNDGPGTYGWTINDYTDRLCHD
jgi:hypothetical protein